VETYVYKLEGSLHAGVKGLDLFMLRLGIHGRQHILTDVEPSLNEVRFVP
jgi:hypothetical protein